MTALRVAITFPHSLGAPGGGTHDCLQLARHLARAGAEVQLVPVRSLGPTSFPRPRLEEPWSGEREAAELAAEGIRVHAVERHPLHYLLDGRPVKRAIGALLDQGPLDVVLGWWNETLFLPRLLADRGVLFAMNAAASYGPLFRGPGSRGLHRRVRNALFFTRPLRAADVVFARSEFTRRELTELGGVDPGRIRVSHLGVDPDCAAVPRDAGPAAGPARLFFFGNLVPEKGILDALEALGRLADRDWVLRVAGWGDEAGVRAAAAAAGIAERVELVGRLERPALLEALEWAQIALLPSHTESFGLANAEAQSAGLPVVACDVAAVPEVVVHGETGWLVPPRRPDALAEALAEALGSPAEARRRGLAGRERVLERFTWERTAASTLAGLEEALGRRAGDSENRP
jgi:glycosyltransferase involved in cell wall biosynthesis